MGQGTLVGEKKIAGAELLKRLRGYAHLNAAFWLRVAGGDDLYLYIASDEITDDNFDIAYGEVLRIAKEMQNSNIDPFEVKFIRVDSPLAEAAIDLYQKRPSRMPTHFNGRSFGGISVDEVHLPSPDIRDYRVMAGTRGDKRSQMGDARSRPRLKRTQRSVSGRLDPMRSTVRIGLEGIRPVGTSGRLEFLQITPERMEANSALSLRRVAGMLFPENRRCGYRTKPTECMLKTLQT